MAGNRVAALTLLFCASLIAVPSLARDRGADGQFSERRSRHFVLRQDVAIDEYSGHRGSRQFELTVLEQLETAYDALGNLVGIRPDRPVEVFVYDPAIFDAEFAGLFRFLDAS